MRSRYTLARALQPRVPKTPKEAAALVQLLALSFASMGKDYKLFSNLYRSLRNRGVSFPEESSVDVFTPNLSEEVVQNVPENVHVRSRQRQK